MGTGWNHRPLTYAPLAFFFRWPKFPPTIADDCPESGRNRVTVGGLRITAVLYQR